MSYYIYHVPGVKIGCTVDPDYRIKYRQNYHDWQILEIHEDIREASKRERQLQKLHGYHVDRTPYWRSVELSSMKTEKKSRATKQNFAQAGIIAYENSTKRKEERLKNFISKLPFKFKVSQALEVAKELNLGRGAVGSYLATDNFIKIKHGTYQKKQNL